MQLLRTIALAAAALGASVLSAAASPSPGDNGTQGFADIGTPSVDTGNINTATTFTIGDLLTTTANTGVFAGLPFTDFGSVAFSANLGTSLSFSDPNFGEFDSASITEITDAPGSVSFYVLGNWIPGTYYTGGSPLDAASLTIAFTQTNTGAISDSATFSIPPTGVTGVPELSTWAMMVFGFAGIGMAGFRRRATRVLA